MDKESNLTSWSSALNGLRILIDQNKKLYKNKDEPAIILRARMTQKEKEKTKEAIDFLYYVLDIEIKKKKGLFR